MNREEFDALTQYEWEDMYEEMLNDCYEVVSVCGYDYDPGYLLKAVDPVAFRVGVSDYMSMVEEDLDEDDEETTEE